MERNYRDARITEIYEVGGASQGAWARRVAEEEFISLSTVKKVMETRADMAETHGPPRSV